MVITAGSSPGSILRLRVLYPAWIVLMSTMTLSLSVIMMTDPAASSFATTKSEATKTVCRLVGHTPGHEYGGLECNNECKIKMNKKESYAESQRNDVKRLTGSNDK